LFHIYSFFIINTQKWDTKKWDTPTYTHTCGFFVCGMMGRFGYEKERSF